MDIDSASPLTAALLLAGTMIVAWAGGYLAGRRTERQGEDSGSADGQIDSAALALLGLLLGFTFAMALQMHDRRREMVVTDANAIGDFSTCVEMLRDPSRSALRQQIYDYVKLRIAAVADLTSIAHLDAQVNRAIDMQSELTRLVAEAVRHPDTPAPVATVLLQKLTDLTSSHAARLAAGKAHLPPTIVGLLFCCAAIAVFLLGREQGRAGKRSAITTALFIGLISFVVLIILDLNQPRRGFIHVSQEPMQRLFDSLPAK